MAFTAAVHALDTDSTDDVQRLKLEIWQKGLPECGRSGCSGEETAADLRLAWWLTRAYPTMRLRGGADGCDGAVCEQSPAGVGVDIDALTQRLGPAFVAALEKNAADHEADCEESCRHFYCGAGEAADPVPATRDYSMGSVPPEDFGDAFRFPLDLIRVTR